MQVKWVKQQHVLERDKRSIIPEYLQVVHPIGYTVQDPLYNDQWYLVQLLFLFAHSFLILFSIMCTCKSVPILKCLSKFSCRKIKSSLIVPRTMLVNQVVPLGWI